MPVLLVGTIFSVTYLHHPAAQWTHITDVLDTQQHTEPPHTSPRMVEGMQT
jgi:hypothetical protein